MCMGCMGNADFLLTGGIVGAASVRVAARSLLPTFVRAPRKVSAEEVSEFLAGLQPAARPGERSDPPTTAADPPEPGEPTPPATRQPAALVH